jgi:Kdo2-lipid IVA lauroyltransferase/acyltransferase
MEEPTTSRKLRYLAEAAVFRAFMAGFRLLGVDGASAVGGFIGRQIFARTRVTKRARDNLKAAFPEKGEAEIDAIIAAMWDNLGRVIAEYAHLDKFHASKDPASRVSVVGDAISDAEMAGGRGVMFLSGHLANWEIMPIAAAQWGYEGGLVYRPPNNPFVADYISRQRALSGPTEQISKHNGARRIFSLLRAGKAIFMLVDQKTNEGIAAPFFSRDAMTTPVPAALALKLGARIVFVSNQRLGGARFRVTVHPPLEFAPSGDEERDVRDLTIAINARVEEMVRADPSQWLWIHRRWPTSRDVVTGKR